MLLSDTDITREIDSGRLKIEGINDIYLGPCSIDMHLDNKCKYIQKTKDYDNGYVYVNDKNSSVFPFIENNGWDSVTIYPGNFYLLSTIEKVTLPDSIAAFVQGRSSLARLGLNIHAAGFIDPGFSGNITLEVTNFTSVPIVIPKETRICQLVFEYTNKPCAVPYNKRKDSKYNNQIGPTLTSIHKDYE